MENFDHFEQQTDSQQEEKYEHLSDEEFYSLCKEKYSYNKNERLKPYKTVTFKKSERGLFSNDLHKISLIDNHFPCKDEIIPGQPYIVEVIRDTNEKESRQGVILLRVIKPAQFDDVLSNKETDNELVQLEFIRSRKNDKEVVSNDFSKITLVDREANMEIQPSDKVLGRISERGTVNVFKPLMKAKVWQKYLVDTGSTNQPFVVKDIYNGIKKQKSDYIYPNNENLDEFKTVLNKSDFAVIKEEVRRKLLKENRRELLGKMFTESMERAIEESWNEYIKNGIVVEEVDKEKESYKVKIEDAWHDVNNQSFVNSWNWNEDSDWRSLVAQNAFRIMKNDKFFVEQLNQRQKVGFDEQVLSNLVPKKDHLGWSKTKEQQVEFFRRFRGLECQRINVDLPYLQGELVFEPVLLRHDDVHDSDWGLHKDDSNFSSSFNVIYRLREEKVNFTDLVNALPEHISQRFKQLISDHINSFKDPAYHFTSFEVASWQADYATTMNELEKMSLDDRLNAKKLLSKDKQEVFDEKMLFAEETLQNLTSNLPVDEYAELDGQGGIKYFGLPVKVRQAFRTKYFSRSGMSTEIPEIGKYCYDFLDYGPEQLTHWLDSHKEYFSKLVKEHENNNRESKLPRLEHSLDKELEKQCAESGISIGGHSTREFSYNLNGVRLNLWVYLSDDFSGLVVRVTNINNGFSNALKAPQELYEFIKKNNWKISESVLTILKNNNVDEKDLRELIYKPEEKIDKKKELPFEAL